MCEGLGNTVSEEEAWGLRFEILGVDARETQGQIQYPALRSACNSKVPGDPKLSFSLRRHPDTQVVHTCIHAGRYS